MLTCVLIVEFLLYSLIDFLKFGATNLMRNINNEGNKSLCNHGNQCHVFEEEEEEDGKKEKKLEKYEKKRSEKKMES